MIFNGNYEKDKNFFWVRQPGDFLKSKKLFFLGAQLDREDKKIDTIIINNNI